MTALIFLDTETCGLSLDDPIWEIAAVCVQWVEAIDARPTRPQPKE